jgi:hypothetical protein
MKSRQANKHLQSNGLHQPLSEAGGALFHLTSAELEIAEKFLGAVKTAQLIVFFCNYARMKLLQKIT